MLAAVNLPDLKALQSGDADAWDAAFRWLWPGAFAVAQLKLQPFLPSDAEDVAMEALEVLVEKVREVRTVDELKPLVASVTHNLSVSRLREHFAAKRGAGQTRSLETLKQDNPDSSWEPAAEDVALASLSETDLSSLLRGIQMELKPDERGMVSDFFLHGRSYAEIASQYGVALGTVGVYLKRGLESIRRLAARHPKMLKELKDFLR